MNRNGRPPRPEAERAARRQQSLKRARDKRRQLDQQRKMAGLCRTCGERVCSRSKVFCGKHLEDHRRHCNKASNKFSKLRANARARGIEIEFTRDEFDEWLSKQEQVCVYCGIEASRLAAHRDKKSRKLTVDRANNQESYKLSNICLACFRCNNMKSNFFTAEQWREIATKFIKPRIDEYHHLITT